MTDFADQDFLGWAGAAPNTAMVEIDRYLVETQGMRAFIKLAWHCVEGEGSYVPNWHIDAMCEYFEAVSRGQLKRVILLIPPRHMKPVWEDEWVILRDQGRVRLRDVVVGDMILTHRGRFRRVMAVHDNGVLQTVTVRTWSNREARMAPDHPVLTPVGWKPAGSLTSNDMVGVVPPREPCGISLPNYEAVASVTDSEAARCICLTVDEDHSFTAGDIAVHNSLCSAVFYPAWDWIAHPERRFLFGSYAFDLAMRDNVKCRRVLQSPWFKARWGDTVQLSIDQNRKDRFDNTRGGYRMATSVDGKVTGEGGDIIVIDDAMNAKDANSEAARLNLHRWWDESMPTRLNDPKTGAFIIVQQRLHANDLVGHILAKKNNRYEVCCLPAEFDNDHPQRWFRDPRKEDGELLWPAHMPREAIEELKEALLEYGTAGQLQQRPSPREGGIFKRAWFAGRALAAPPDTTWSSAWDFAATAAKVTKTDPDWTANALVGFSRTAGKYYVKRIRRWREDAGTIRKLVKSIAETDTRAIKITIPQDPGQAGKDQAAQYVLLLSGWEVLAEPQTGDKMTRAMGFAAQASVGNVVLIEDPTQEAWIETFLTELTSFPTGAHDDQIDAVSSAYNRLTDSTSGIIDYYRDMLAAKEAAKAALPVIPENGVIAGDHTDIGKAMEMIRGMNS